MLYLPAESGQALLEYALILVLIAVAVVGIVSVFGTTVFEVFSDVGSQLDQARADAN
jgi:pilus assembly protein Flp/PilA